MQLGVIVDTSATQQGYKMKQHRWFEIVENTLFVYDSPTASTAKSVSICATCDLPYYRKTFNLRKIWSKQ